MRSIPEVLTASFHGRRLLICEVALGTEAQHEVALECSSNYSHVGLLQKGLGSVQCHRKDFGQEERVVYHCIQCKPGYMLETPEVDPEPRWAEHCRPENETNRGTERRKFPEPWMTVGPKR